MQNCCSKCELQAVVHNPEKLCRHHAEEYFQNLLKVNVIMRELGEELTAIRRKELRSMLPGAYC